MQRKIVEDQSTEHERDIWSAIRYLDPDKKNEAGDSDTTKTVLALVLLCLLWVFVHFRVL